MILQIIVTYKQDFTDTEPKNLLYCDLLLLNVPILFMMLAATLAHLILFTAASNKSVDVRPVYFLRFASQQFQDQFQKSLLNITHNVSEVNQFSVTYGSSNFLVYSGNHDVKCMVCMRFVTCFGSTTFRMLQSIGGSIG